MFHEGKTLNEAFINKYKDIADVTGIDEVFNMDMGEGSDVFVNYYGAEEAVQGYQNSLQSNLFTERRSCRYPFTHMTIRNDGTVVVCCADWLKELRFGNVKERSLKELWESKSLYDLRLKMLATKGQCFKACRACEIPYRDFPEDSVDGIDISRFCYRNEY